jgi:hypothetical protein
MAVARVAAGVTWTCVIANAPWPARHAHTTVIDAAGAIYVIGGSGSTGPLNDMWVSTDGGADRSCMDTQRGYLRSEVVLATFRSDLSLFLCGPARTGGIHGSAKAGRRTRVRLRWSSFAYVL